jgi:aldehyde:ferredoxin oxidoreductase
MRLYLGATGLGRAGMAAELLYNRNEQERTKMTVGGTWGKILHVDLTNDRKWVESPPDDVYLKLIGGRGLAAWLLLKHMAPGADALGPENVLVFAPGVLQGTNLPSTGRHGVAAKSPLTGGIASSEAGGWWGHEFKRTGYDALVVHGRAAEPVYLAMRDTDVTVRSAAHLWGRDTADVETAIRQEMGDDKVRIAQAGVAGENGVLFSGVMHDVNRAAGRGGLGAVMGSKNLKAVAIRGTRNLTVVERKRIVPIAKWFGDTYKESMDWAVKMGTPGSVANGGRSGNLPVRNFRDPVFEDAKSIDGKLMDRTIRPERDTCQACPVYCKQVVEYDGVKTFEDEPLMKTKMAGKTAIERVYGGPEYETLGALGSACGVNDLIAVAKANELCARWGLDTISAGMTIAFVMECVEAGLLTKERTGGYLPSWGDAAAMLEGVDMIAHCRGFGAEMAQGSKRLAAAIGNGTERFLVEVKGQELPMHEPRIKFGLGVGYAVAPVGADHMMNVHDGEYSSLGDGLKRVNAVYETGPLATTDLGLEKMTLVYHELNWKHFMDCAVTCMFYPYDYIQLAEAVSGATGRDYNPSDILQVGERAQTLCRLFNLREGLSAADDRIPKRVMKAFESGPLAGIEITDAALMAALLMWYTLMGYTEEGVPTEARLEELGLAELLP